MKTLLFLGFLTLATARRHIPVFPMEPTPKLSPYGPTKIGTWGLPKEDKREVKEVKRTVKQSPFKEVHENQCGPWGVHSVHELEDIMGLE